LDIFKNIYPPENKVRHVIWITSEMILIQKTVSTKDVNEFMLKNPNSVDVSLVKAFGEDFEGLNVFFVEKIEIDEDENF